MRNAIGIVLLALLLRGVLVPALAQAQSAPASTEAAIQTRLEQVGSPLADYQDGGYPAAFLIASYSDYYQVDPALLLAAMDAATGVVSQPTAPESVLRQPFGAQGPRGFTAQLAWVVGELVRGRGQQDPRTLRFADGTRVTLDPAQHSGDWLALRTLLAEGRTHAAWLALDERVRASYAAVPVRAPVVVSSQSFAFVQPPTISEDHYVAILTAAGSPAAAEGRAMYRVLVAAGVDPAIELAFSRKETEYGTTGPGRAPQHNLHGITCNGWDGGTCTGPHHYRFSTYPSYTASVQAWATLIRAYSAGGLVTPRLALPVYAPSFENNTDLSITQVEQWLYGWRNAEQERSAAVVVGRGVHCWSEAIPFPAMLPVWYDTKQHAVEEVPACHHRFLVWIPISNNQVCGPMCTIA